MNKAVEIRERGESLIADKHYAVDSISPKCVELETMVGDLKLQLQRKLDMLRKYCDLHEKIEKVFFFFSLTLTSLLFNV